MLGQGWDVYRVQRLKEPMVREARRISSMEIHEVENKGLTSLLGAGVIS